MTYDLWFRIFANGLAIALVLINSFFVYQNYRAHKQLILMRRLFTWLCVQSVVHRAWPHAHLLGEAVRIEVTVAGRQGLGPVAGP